MAISAYQWLSSISARQWLPDLSQPISSISADQQLSQPINGCLIYLSLSVAALVSQSQYQSYQWRAHLSLSLSVAATPLFSGGSVGCCLIRGRGLVYSSKTLWVKCCGCGAMVDQLVVYCTPPCIITFYPRLSPFPLIYLGGYHSLPAPCSSD